MTKIAQQIAQEYANRTADVFDVAEDKAIAKDQVWEAELTKYTFDDNSVLAVSGSEIFGMDADDADSIRAYGEFAGEAEADEVARLLEALED